MYIILSHPAACVTTTRDRDDTVAGVRAIKYNNIYGRRRRRRSGVCRKMTRRRGGGVRFNWTAAAAAVHPGIPQPPRRNFEIYLRSHTNAIHAIRAVVARGGTLFSSHLRPPRLSVYYYHIRPRTLHVYARSWRTKYVLQVVCLKTFA